MDVGRPADLFGANIAAARRKGRTDHSDAVRGSKIAGTFYLGAGAEAIDCEISDTVISAGSRIIGSKVKDSLIMAGCTITGAEISGSIIGEACVIQKGASVIGSVIADGTVIGENETRRGTQ